MSSIVLKIPYTSILQNGKYRPNLEVFFFYNNSLSSRTLGLIDSGADQIIIPFTLGKQIGLPPRLEGEQLGIIGGIVSGLPYLERKCRIYVPRFNEKVVYGYDATVFWVHPDDEAIKERTKLRSQFINFLHLKLQCRENTELEQHFETEMSNAQTRLRMLDDMYEPTVLLGRNFFNNFDYIQFFQRDIDQENSCSFHIQLSTKKIAHTLSLT